MSAWVLALVVGVGYMFTKKRQLQDMQSRAMAEYYGNKPTLGPVTTQHVRQTLNTNMDNRFVHMSTDLTREQMNNLDKGAQNILQEAHDFDGGRESISISGMGPVLFHDS